MNGDVNLTLIERNDKVPAHKLRHKAKIAGITRIMLISGQLNPPQLTQTWEREKR